MDGRIALTPGAELKLTTDTGYTLYTINREIGRGGSCIVYDASYTDNLGNFKLVRIKECYPHAMRLTRQQDLSLLPEERDANAFAAAKGRLKVAYQRNHELFSLLALTNAVSGTSNIYEANGTVYVVSVYMNGKTFTDFQGDTLHDCVALIRSAARVLKRIHDAEYLYLDLKPDNILTLEGSLDLVQLFDFDSMISMEELAAAIQGNASGNLPSSYTKGYASLEQQTGKLRQLGRHSDLYSLGAVLFWALWHRTPTAFDCEADAEYDYNHMVYAGKAYQDRLFRVLTHFFHKTLASYYVDRYQSTEEAIEQLSEILSLSDETKPWLRSTPVQTCTDFYGRQHELEDLSGLLHQAEHGVASLYGMGGIGKSTLARQYLVRYANDWDAVLFLYDQGNLADSLSDDTLVQISTIHRAKEESTEDYLQRKLEALAALAREQRILLVVDNFTADHLEQLEPLRQIGWTILLISRERMPEGMFPALLVEELEAGDLQLLFEHYAHCKLDNENDLAVFENIIDYINGHTLLTELIARQIAKSYLDIQAAETMIAGIGLADLPKEKIDYIHDQSAYHETLLKILDRLVEIDQFSEQDRVCMKMLSLFYAPGIDAGLFKELAALDSLDFVNELETSGWVKTEGPQLYLHPMMQEYVRTWPWSDTMQATADQMMRSLYERIRPSKTRHDVGRQFPADYDSLYRLLHIARQMVDSVDQVTEAAQRLLFRWLMDSPVDQDTPVLFRMLDLLEHPDYLDVDSILRLYETAAYYRARLYITDDAIKILKDMKRYLRKHPSAYYLSAYHRAMGVILHNATRDTKTILNHHDKSIAAARVSTHPDAKKQLTACMMNKARTLMSERVKQDEVRKLIREAEPLVSQYTEPLDYERYQFLCNAAMCFAMDGDADAAEKAMEAADAIAYASPDSDLAIAEHLIEEVAPFRIEMGQFDMAEKVVLEAIDICEGHPDVLRYRETVFDAWLFLGRIYAMDEDYIHAEEAFGEAEKRVHDSPYQWKQPLCPENVREKAEVLRTENDDRQNLEENMETQIVTINGKEITIPAYYQKVDSMPDDPENSVPYMVQTGNAMCFVLISPVDESKSLPRTKDTLIAGIRPCLSEKQGLIQVEVYEDHVFSIVKTLKEPSVVQYILTYQKFYPEFILNIQAYFEEIGTTGMRDTIAYELCRRQNLVGTDNDPFEGWMRDPYDETIKEGALMNLSETEQFDKYFPGFPLTMCREFLRAIE